MLLMLFVNDIGDIDLGHIHNAPWWLKHMPRQCNGMTMPDVIFPCFLFIVGLSLPIALEQRIARGDALVSIVRHILARSAALIFIGLCMVNSCHGYADSSASAMGMSWDGWRLLLFLGIIAFWNRYPKAEGAKRWWLAALRMGAAGLLIYLVAIYRIESNGASIWMRPLWWGIIGLIGWSYLVSAFIWLLCRKHPAALIGVFALLLALNIGLQHGILSGWDRIVRAACGWVPGMGMLASAAMPVAGMLVATWDSPGGQTVTPGRRVVRTLLIGVGFAVSGLLLQPFGGIHKSGGTPAWILFSLAIACTVYGLLYWLVDVRKITRWTVLMAPAGSNTLLMYMLPYVFYSVLSILGITYLQNHFCDGWSGVLRSAVIAFGLMGMTAVLTRCGIRLKV